MKKAHFLAFLVLILPAIASAQSAEEIIAKHLEATGAANWSKVNSIKMEATISSEAAAGMSIGWTMTALRDKAARMDVSVMGMTQSSAVKDGAGWSNNPFAGQMDAEPITEDQAKSIMDMTDIDGTLVGYAEKGYTVEYVGTEEVEGVEAVKIKVNKGGKKVEYVLFDPETYYEIMNIQVDEVDGKEVESKTSYSDFKEQDGIILPFSMQQENPMMGNSTITLTSITINPKIDMTIFDMPAKK
ncbi:MAG: hypothetical protein R3D58_15745 [Saprospiraceae bacterium]|jgi:outer membrane lipoprotein-sorting protein|nr:hypothetical protein [Lewinellaceae bacterium]